MPDTDISRLLASFRRHLAAEGRAPATLQTYSKAVNQLDAYLEGKAPAAVGRPDIEDFLVSLREAGNAPATISQRFRSLQQFWRWLEEEEEIEANPMRGLRRPRIPDVPPPLLRETDFRAMLGKSASTTFPDRRDTAILHMLWATGMRRAECSEIRLQDIDWETQEITVTGKGGKVRRCPLTRVATAALDRYVRARDRHPAADLPWLWLGKRGKYTETGIEMTVKRRAKAANVQGRIYPHLFRHTWAHRIKAAGLSDEVAMELGGWTTPTILHHYGRSARAERARDAYRRVMDATR